MTSAFGILADLFEPRERAKYQGYSSAVFTLSGLIGPVAGGLIAQAIGWQYIFLINLPIGIVVFAVVAMAMPNTSTHRSHKIDYLGGLLLAGSVTMLVFWAEDAMGGSYSGPLLYVLPALIVIALAAFVWVEQRAVEPILPLHLLGNSTISLTLAMSILMGIATLGMLNYFALFLQTVTGLPPALAGLLFLPASVGSLIASIGSGNLIARTGRYKIYPVIGMAIGVLVLLSFLLVNAATPLWVIGIMMFCFSTCMGLQMQTLMVAVQSAAPRADVGAATGSLSLARMIGASVGLAANGGLLQGGLARAQAALDPALKAQLPAPVSDLTPIAIKALPPEIAAQIVQIFGSAFATVFYFGAGMFALGLVLSLFLKNVQLPVHAKAGTAAGSNREAESMRVPAHE
jgi:MFS family permease